MKIRFLIYFTILTAVLGTATFYIGVHVISEFGWAVRHERVLWLSLGLFVVVELLGPILYRVYPNSLNEQYIFLWISNSFLGIFACLLFYTIASDIILMVWRLLSTSSDRPSLEHIGFLIVLIVATASVVIGFFQAVGGPQVFRVEIPLKNLPKEFDGFKIVQISDLHIGPTIGQRYARRVTEVANSLEPDLVALTGDFVDGEVNSLREGIKPIGGIKAKHGAFYVTGNHEYYWGAQEWIEEFRKIGARVLLNEHVLIQEKGKSFVLAGVTDYSAGYMLPGHTSDPQKSVLGAPPNAVKILLAHQPASYKQAYEAGIHLQLSGHTHGGQFFPWSLVVKMVQRYYKGLNKHKDMWVYVNRGTGYWGPPIRFAVPAEVTLIQLKSV